LSNNEDLNLKPLSMFKITAKLMNHISDSIKASFDNKGMDLIYKGIKSFNDEQEDLIKKATATFEVSEKALYSYEDLLEAETVHETYKYFAYAQDEANVRQPVSIYAVMAKVFGHVTKAVVDEFGKEGEEAIKEGVWNFGEERGKNIAKRAASAGQPNTKDNYLPYYDMGRSDLFEIETVNHPDKIEQTFTACAFGDQWQEDGMGKYGILYCQMIDPALARGYHPNFDVVHDEYTLQEGQCHFLFQMNEDKENHK